MINSTYLSLNMKDTFFGSCSFLVDLVKNNRQIIPVLTLAQAKYRMYYSLLINEYKTHAIERISLLSTFHMTLIFATSRGLVFACLYAEIYKQFGLF